MKQWQPKPKIIQQKFINQPVLLYRGFTELIDNENTIEGKSWVYISWYPFPQITVKFIYHGEDRTEFKPVELKLTELIPQERIKVQFSRGTYYGNGKNELNGGLLEPFRKGTTDNLSSLTFHLTNFFEFNISNRFDYEYDKDGNEIEVNREGWLNFFGQFIFDYDNWHLVLASLDETGQVEEKLNEQGGYCITHICKIKRSDNQIFNLDKSYQIIDAFIYFLSFVRGIWVAPLFISGFNAEGTQILEEWSTPKIKADSWQSTDYSWTHNDTTEWVSAFPGFMKKWQDENWHETIKNAIQWYIESYDHTNDRNTSIILVQSALEKLAWTYLNTNNCISSNSFQKLTFDDKVRLLLKLLNIEIIPIKDEWEITKLGKQQNWTSIWLDSINLIGQIRNLIVHPKIAQKENKIKISKTVLNEVFIIGHHYLLECLLKIFEYPY